MCIRVSSNTNDSLVPLIYRMVVHEYRLDLYSAQESQITDCAVVDVESDC